MEYEEEKFIGKVISKDEEKQLINIHCLEKPFGVKGPQKLEPDAYTISEVFYTDAKPYFTNVGPDGQTLSKRQTTYWDY